MRYIVFLFLINLKLFACSAGCIDMSSTIFQKSITATHKSYVQSIKSKIKELNKKYEDINEQRKEMYQNERNDLNELNKIGSARMNMLLSEMATKVLLTEKRIEMISVRKEN